MVQFALFPNHLFPFSFSPICSRYFAFKSTLAITMEGDIYRTSGWDCFTRMVDRILSADECTFPSILYFSLFSVFFSFLFFLPSGICHFHSLCCFWRSGGMQVGQTDLCAEWIVSDPYYPRSKDEGITIRVRVQSLYHLRCMYRAMRSKFVLLFHDAYYIELISYLICISRFGVEPAVGLPTYLFHLSAFSNLFSIEWSIEVE